MLIAPTHGTYVGVSIPQALETRADATPAGARHSDGAAPGVGVAGGERGERRRSARPHRIQGAARVWRLPGILERIVPTPPSASVRGQWARGLQACGRPAPAGANPPLFKKVPRPVGM